MLIISSPVVRSDPEVFLENATCKIYLHSLVVLDFFVDLLNWMVLVLDLANIHAMH